MRKKILGLFAGSCLAAANAMAGGTPSNDCKLVKSWNDGKHFMVGKVNVTVLKGSYREMGKQYGALLKDKIQFMYDTAIEKPMIKSGVTTYEKLKKEMHELGWKGLTRNQREMFRGMAETSGIDIDKLVMLDQSVTLTVLYLEKAFGLKGFGACSCLSTWGDYTTDGKTVVGRNFDWLNLFIRCSKAFGVIVLQPNDGNIETAIVGYAGWLNALSGMNREGLFMETNSGLNSAGIKVYSNRSPYINEHLNMLLDSEDIEVLKRRLFSTRPHAGILVNIADENIGYCFENDCNQTLMRKASKPGLLVTSNEFRLESWGLPVRESGTHSVRRFDNLNALAQKYKGKINPQIMMKILDEPLHLGGGKFGNGATKPTLEPNDEDVTVHQIIAVPGKKELWLKVPGHVEWTYIDLKQFFSK